MSNAGPVTKLSELLLIDFSAISAISFFFFQHDFIVPFRLRSQGISEISLIFQCCCSATSFSYRKEIDSRWLLLQFYRNADPAKISQVSSCWSRQFMVRIFPHLLGLCNLFPLAFHHNCRWGLVRFGAEKAGGNANRNGDLCYKLQFPVLHTSLMGESQLCVHGACNMSLMRCTQIKKLTDYGWHKSH